MANLGWRLEIDASDLQDELDRLKSVMTEEQFNRAMYRIFQRTGGHVRRILKSDLPKQYHIRAGDIASDIKGTKISSGGNGGVGCTIPIIGVRKTVGGTYRASGGAHGWNSLKRKYRVKARIVKSGQSVLPPQMPSYGGNPPFRNLGSSLGGVTFTRKTKARFPIAKVQGIAIPQMPMNRSQADVQKDILEYMERRIEHEFQQLIAGGR
nr:MAG TPA: minor tail protein [Caudoviricetes sp.]